MTFDTSIEEVLAHDEYRVEGHLKVTGRARYAADVRRTGMLHAVYLRSPYPHALIRSIDTSQARSAPGVRAVLVGADLPEHARFGRRLQDWPVLARGKVRFIGDRVAAVAADTRQAAEAAVRAANSGRGVAADIRHIGGGKTSMRMRLLPSSGEIEVLTGMVDQGAGAPTVIRRVAAAALSIAPERILVRYGDTGEAPPDPGAGGSRVTHVVGQAVLDGGQRLKTTLEDLAAEAFGWPAGEVRLEGDRFVAGPHESASFDDVAKRVGSGAPVEVTGSYADVPHDHDAGGDFTAAVYAVEVEVDPETGAFRVRDALQVVDVGTIINPLAHQGQLNGGLAFGVGAALMEDLAVDEGGNVSALSLAEYKLPTSMDMPPLRMVLLHTKIGPARLGRKLSAKSPTAALRQPSPTQFTTPWARVSPSCRSRPSASSPPSAPIPNATLDSAGRPLIFGQHVESQERNRRSKEWNSSSLHPQRGLAGGLAGERPAPLQT